MPITRTLVTGDGIATPYINLAFTLPDASAGSIPITGELQVPGLPLVNVSGSPLTMPADPGSGTLSWNIAIDYNTGAATLRSSAAGDPACASTEIIILREQLTASSPAAAFNPTTQDTPAPSATGLLDSW